MAAAAASARRTASDEADLLLVDAEQGAHATQREPQREAGPGEDVELDALIERLGTTPLHWQCVGILGLANAADAVEVLAIGYILTVFKDPVSGKPIDELPFWSGLLTSAVFAGMLGGGLMSGALGDRFGRRPLLSLSLLINAASAGISAATPALPARAQVPWLIFFRFVGGLGVGGSVPAAFSLGAELGPSATRALFINAIACFWSVGTLYTSLCAYAILRGTAGEHWPLFAALVAVPGFTAGALCVWRLQESPRFLWNAKRYGEALDVLDAFAASVPASPAGSALDEELRVARESAVTRSADAGMMVDCVERRTGSAAAMLRNAAELFSGRTARWRTSMLCGIFFCLSFAHYGISSWISDLFAKVHFNDPYGTALFYAAATAPGLLTAVLLVDRVGRRALTAGAMGAACLSALLFALNTDDRAFVVLSAVAFNACAACAWNGLDVFSAELLPSRLRGTGLGLAAAAGRVGSICANMYNSFALAHVATSDEANVAAVLAAAGLAMLVGATCATALPETLGRHQDAAAAWGS